MKLTDKDILVKTGASFKPYLELIPHLSIQEAEQLKQQILADQKLRESFEIFFNGDNVMVKKEYKKLLEESKNEN